MRRSGQMTWELPFVFMYPCMCVHMCVHSLDRQGATVGVKGGFAWCLESPCISPSAGAAPWYPFTYPLSDDLWGHVELCPASLQVFTIGTLQLGTLLCESAPLALYSERLFFLKRSFYVSLTFLWMKTATSDFLVF